MSFVIKFFFELRSESFKEKYLLNSSIIYTHVQNKSDGSNLKLGENRIQWPAPLPLDFGDSE